VISPKQAGPISDEDRRAAADGLLDLTGDLVRKLQTILRSDDVPRWQYVHALQAVGQYLEAISAGHDVAEHFLRLGIALCDLECGIVDPVLAPIKGEGPGDRGDHTRAWQARAWIALGMECLLKSGLTRDEAVAAATSRWPGLREILDGRSPQTLLTWRDRFWNGEVTNSSARKGYKRFHDALAIGKITPDEHGRLAPHCFARALQVAGM
jgi:hypothetical protein